MQSNLFFSFVCIKVGICKIRRNLSVFISNGISNFTGSLLPNVILVEQKCCWKDNEIHAFSKSISLKLDVIKRLEFELTNIDTAIKHISNCLTESSR